MDKPASPIEPFPPGDYDGETDASYDPSQEDYRSVIEADHRPCFLSHTTHAHLTFQKADGSFDTDEEGFEPIEFIDTDVHPRLDFNFQGRMTDPANARAPLTTDCVMLAFYGIRPGSQRWGGRLQVICRRAYQEDRRGSVWLHYNGLQNPGAARLEQRYHTPERFMFTRRLEQFRRDMSARAGMPGNARYRERLYISVDGCHVKVIGEASVQNKQTGDIVRTTRIHDIDCCHTPDEYM